jgi:hypothetical protein
MKTLKLTVSNGRTQLFFNVVLKNGGIEDNLEFIQDYLYNGLINIIQKQNRLRELGAKGNFFGLSTSLKNIVSLSLIDDVNDDVQTVTGIKFNLNSLLKLSEPKEAFNIIFGSQIELIEDGITIQ